MEIIQAETVGCRAVAEIKFLQCYNNLFFTFFFDSGMRSLSLSYKTSWSSWGKRSQSASGPWSKNTPCTDRNYNKPYNNMTPDPSPVTL